MRWLVAEKDRFIHWMSNDWPGVLVILIAGFLRFYRLGQQPLWLDEIYTAQLGRLGFLAILDDSLRDPHPPGHHLLQWLASGFGSAQSEWGWRWLSALSGLITVVIVYVVFRRLTGRLGATLAALMLAVSPFHIYYSQEGRPYAFLTLMASWTMLLMANILEDPRPRGRWVALALLSLFGLYNHYLYLLIIGVQGLSLLLYVRVRNWWLYASIVTLGTVLAAFLMVPTLNANTDYLSAITPMTILGLIQSLAGEPVRFPVQWQHWYLAFVLGGLSVIGAIIAIKHLRTQPLTLYLVLQVLLPIIFVFGALGLLGINFPIYHTRQLLFLIPAFFGLAALGLDFLQKRLGWLLPTLLFVIALAASGAGLLAYWDYPKSPEGLAALAVHYGLQDGDAVVSLYYSTDAAAFFYLPDVRVWTYLRQDNNIFEFSDDLRLHPYVPFGSKEAADITIENLRSQPRLWVMSRNDHNADVFTALTKNCTLVKQETFYPFDVSLWEQCSP